MLATAANFETRTNGATHMGNDDNTIFDGLAHLKIVDASCPQQLLAIMRWIMDGNRGLVYLRVMRTPSPVVYPADYAFEFGKAVVLRSAGLGGGDHREQRARRPRGARRGVGMRRRAASPSASSTCRRSTKTCWSICAARDG